MPLAKAYAASYEKFADYVAVRDPSGDLTYAELGLQAELIAQGLMALGLSSGDRVLLIAPNSCEWTEVDHAVTKGGLVRVAVLSRLHPNELAAIAHDAEPAAVIADGAWMDKMGDAWVPESVRVRVSLGSNVPGMLSLDEVKAAGGSHDLEEVGDDALLWIGYTSGSTGMPKGVLNTSSTLGAVARNILSELPALSPASRVVHSAPLSHFTGAIAAAVTSVGGTNVCVPTFDRAQLITMLEQGDANVMPLVPTQINMLVETLIEEESAGRTHDVSGLKMLPYAGSAIAPDRAAAAKRVLGDVLTQFYGSSEAPMPVTALQPQDHSEQLSCDGRLPLLASAGRVNQYCQVRILGSEGKVLPLGEVGELAVKGQQTSPGYWRNDEATAELFADGWVRTGDAGYLDADGYLFIVDRKKDMVVTGGFNVYPREIENVISTLAGVREVAVVGAPDPRWGEQILAVVSLLPGAALAAEDVVAHCRAQLGGYKVPKTVEIVSELPKLGSGKIAKRQIRDRLWADEARRV